MKRLHELLIAGLLSLAGASGASAQVSVTTWQVNNQHTGNNNQETQLTPGIVGSPGNFGLLSYPQMDGQSFGQPLLVSGIHAGHDMAYAATQRCNIYGFDVTAAGVATQVWTQHLVPAAVSSYVPLPAGQSGSGDISDVVGLTTTPVIDSATSTIYVVSKLYNPAGGSTLASSYHQYLYALDLLTGAAKYGSPIEITASFSGASGSDSSGGVITFNSYREHLRSAMTLENGILYLAYASHSDTDPYHGEVLGFNPTTLALVKTFITSPYNNTKAGLWNGGASPAFDVNHNMYLSVANGDYNPAQGNWGESIVKLVTSGAPIPMAVNTASTANWFTPAAWQTQLNQGDLDLGSGGLLLVPDNSAILTNNKNLVIGGGKGAVLYVLDRDNLGGLNTNDTGVLQQIASPGDWIFSTPAYYNGNVYLAASGAVLKQYKLGYNAAGQTYLTLQASTSDVYNNKGATPFVSSNGNTNGIVWVQFGSGVRAYDAASVSGAPILSINATVPPSTGCQNAKFNVPMVANGKLFFAASDSTNKSYLFVCGLLPTAPGAPAAASNAVATALSASSAQVTWTDNSGGTAQFYVKRSTSQTGAFNTVSGTSPLNAGTTSYTDTGLTAASVYYYQVVATNNAGNANASNVAALTTFPTYSENGLVAFWPLEEVGKTTTSDITGNGHNGTVPAGEGDIVANAGLVNNGFHAHGTGQAVSRVTVPDDVALRFTAAQSFTLSAWVQPDAVRSTEQTVLAKARNSATGYYGIWIDASGHWIGRGPGGDIVSTATMTATVWTHVALVQDGAAGTRKLYVNGVLNASGSAQAADGLGDLWMTQQNVSGNVESMPGDIDEVRLYSRALAAGEITTLIAPPVYEADSLQDHGTGTNKTTFGVSIWPAATRKIEPRRNATNAYKLQYTFATPLKTGVSTSTGTAALDPTNNRRVNVTLTAIDKSVTNIILSNLVPSSAPAGTPAGSVSIPFNVLWGDVNGDSIVSSLDLNIETNSRGIATADTARYDLDLSGVEDANDDAIVQTAITAGDNLGAQTDTNLAIYQPATASSPTTGNVAAFAVDGNTTGTRWESASTDPQWIMVDLGAICSVHQVVLNWENAAGKTYTIDLSNDGVSPAVQNGANWTRFATESANTGGGIKKYANSLTGRYVRVFGTTRTTGYGYSLWDLQVIGLSGSSGGAAPVITSTTLPSGTVGTAYSATLAASNSPTSFALVSGTLPAGLSFATATGTISGTPSATASGVSLGFTATNATGTSPTKTVTLTIAAAGAAPVITTASLPSGTVGTAYTATLAASNNPTSFALVSGTLPAGLTFSPSTGTISGTPSAVANAVSLGFTASNASGTSPTKTLTLTVNAAAAAPVITTTTLPSGTVGTAYTTTLAASNNPTSFALVTGTLPAGLSFAAATGTISGTPTAVANAVSLSFTASNATGTSPAKTLTLTIAAAGAKPVITSGAPPSGSVGTAYAGYTITASNSPTSYTAANLPPSLTLNTTTGVITGTPTMSGNYATVALSATNAAGTGPITFVTIAIALPGGDTNLALNKTPTASSFTTGHAATAAVDGVVNTRWESTQGLDNQFIYVDLGAAYTIDSVLIDWEGAYGKVYRVEVAANGSDPSLDASYTQVAGETNNTTAGVHQYNLSPAVTGRYVRVYGVTRGTIYGFSIYELQVLGH